MSSLALIFIAFWVSLLPVYLWGYGVTYLLSDTWNRIRFWVWIFLWWIGVSLTYIFAYSYNQDWIYEWLILAIFLLILLIVVLILTLFWSRFSRSFLRKIAIVHVIVIWLIIWFVYIIWRYFPIPDVFTPIVILFLLTPILEEAAKHLGSIGLIWHEFRFSQRDILSFTFFVVLWFVFAENLLYLASGKFSLWIWIMRSLFTLIAHVFTALICAHFWWKALSYPLLSLRYVSIFLTWFILAGWLHILYNYLLADGNILGLLLYIIIWYILVIVKKH